MLVDMKYSDKTIAELCRELGAAVRTHSELELLFLEHGLQYDQFGGGLRSRSNALVMALHGRDDGSALTQLLEYVLKRRGAG